MVSLTEMEKVGEWQTCEFELRFTHCMLEMMEDIHLLLTSQQLLLASVMSPLVVLLIMTYYSFPL